MKLLETLKSLARVSKKYDWKELVIPLRFDCHLNRWLYKASHMKSVTCDLALGRIRKSIPPPGACGVWGGMEPPDFFICCNVSKRFYLK